MLLLPPSRDTMRFKPYAYQSPMVPPPLADVPRLPPESEFRPPHERAAYAFLKRYVVGNDLLIRWRDKRFMWIRNTDGTEQVYAKGNLLWLISDALHTPDGPWPTDRLVRRVYRTILPLTLARSGRLEEITPEALGRGLLALYDRENLRYVGGRWTDTINLQDARLPASHMRDVAKRLIAETYAAEGVRGFAADVTDDLIAATLRAAARLSIQHQAEAGTPDAPVAAPAGC